MSHGACSLILAIGMWVQQHRDKCLSHGARDGNFLPRYITICGSCHASVSADKNKIKCRLTAHPDAASHQPVRWMKKREKAPSCYGPQMFLVIRYNRDPRKTDHWAWLKPACTFQAFVSYWRPSDPVVRCSHFPAGCTGLEQGNSTTQARKLFSAFILRRADLGQPGTDTFIYLLEAVIILWRCQYTHMHLDMVSKQQLT